MFWDARNVFGVPKLLAGIFFLQSRKGQHKKGLGIEPMAQILFVLLPNNVKTQKSKFMFSERIKELRVQNQMPQRQLAAALDIDTATYCKIEKGERRAKKEQVSILSKLFNVNAEQLLTLWLADQVSAVVSSEQKIAPQALSLVVEALKRDI